MLSLLLLLACTTPDSSPAPVEAAECDCEGTGKGDSKADSQPVEEQVKEFRVDCIGDAPHVASVDIGVTMPSPVSVQVWAHHPAWFVEISKTYKLDDDISASFQEWEAAAFQISGAGEVVVRCAFETNPEIRDYDFLTDYFIVYVK